MLDWIMVMLKGEPLGSHDHLDYYNKASESFL